MFLPAICDKEECLVNVDFIVEVYDLNKPKVKAYTMDSEYPFYIDNEVFNDWLSEYYVEFEEECDDTKI